MIAQITRRAALQGAGAATLPPAAFAQGAPQEDDITLLLVKRELPVARRAFPRSFASIPAMVAFRREFFAAHAIPDDLGFAIDFTIEELFTNMVARDRTLARDFLSFLIIVSSAPLSNSSTRSDFIAL